MPFDVFPVDWRTTDNDHFAIQLYGKTEGGEACTVSITFYPYFFVGIPNHWSAAKIKLFIANAVKKYNAHGGLSTSLLRKSLHGFTNGEERHFVQLAFEKQEHFRKARYAIQRNENLQTYEASLDPLLRFYHVRDIEPSQWVRLHCEPNAEQTYDIDFREISKSPSRKQPPLIFASWDLECISESGKFPCSDIPGDKIITIGTAFQRYGEPEPYHRVVVTLDTCDPIPGVEVIPCSTEADAINAWLHTLRAHSTDVMVGYNTYQFDLRYLYGRSAVCVGDDGESLVELELLGKGPTGGGEPLEKKLSSAAYGDNKFFLLGSPGVMQVDLLQIFRKELKLDSYSLGNVSKLYLKGLTKIDLSPGDIFRKFRGSSTDRAEIASYCIRDVELPLQLMAKLCTFENLLEMANCACVPIEYLALRGQQIKVFSMLTRKARALGFVAPDLERDEELGGKYEGATVLEAKKGAYFDPVSGLDFASLYPSIMRAHNMCPSTLVIDPKYDDLEGVEYYAIKVGDTVHKFAQNTESVVPALLEDLATFRKQAKKEMALAKEKGDSFAEALFNAKQLAYKISTNSVYGFFGALRGMFPCVPIASSVTATGRHMIEHSKKLAEELVPGTEVVYGDSVAYYTPIIVRVDGFVECTTFEALTFGHEWKRCADGGNSSKEYCVIPEATVDIWSDQGWTPLHRVLRHRLDPEKSMMRVVTTSGLIDVTNDHSLLFPDGTAVKPGDIGIGSELLHKDLPVATSQFRPGDPLASPREQRYEHWISGSAPQILRPETHLDLARTFAMGATLWDGVTLDYIATDETTVQMDLAKVGGTGNDTVVSVTPIEYPLGAYVYDATTENHHFAAGIGRLVVHNTDSIMCKFKVAPGKEHDMHEHFRVAQKVASEISRTFKHPIELEFEKVYEPYLLFTKKRYAGLMYTCPEKPDYIDIKGLQLVRRDSPPIVKEVSNAILDCVMHEKSVSAAVKKARDFVFDVLNGTVPMEKFIVSKQLKSTYVNEAAQPHLTVARKIFQRTGTPVMQGERVPYVFIVDKVNLDGLMAARAEDPNYVRDHNLEIDYLYYLKNQLMSPITTLLEVLVDAPDEVVLKDPRIQEKLQVLETERKHDIKTTKRIKLNSTRKQHEITSFFKFVDD